MKKVLSMVAMSGFLFLGTGAAYGLAVTDVTLNGEYADAVYDFVADNDNAGLVSGAIGGDPFVLLAKSDENSDIYLNGLEFDLSATIGQSGTFILSWVGGPPPPPSVFFDFAFAVKASPGYALYLFDDTEIAYSPDAYNGTYTITFLNPGGQTPDLSHLSVYGRTGDPVPEPATMLLFGTGLIGLAGIGRKKRS